jgi:hypothetical protein
LLGHGKTGVHQHATHRVVTRTAFGSRTLLAHHADRLVLFAAIDELRRVVEHQHWSPASGCEPLLRAEKVPRQNLVLADPAV